MDPCKGAAKRASRTLDRGEVHAQDACGSLDGGDLLRAKGGARPRREGEDRTRATDKFKAVSGELRDLVEVDAHELAPGAGKGGLDRRPFGGVGDALKTHDGEALGDREHDVGVIDRRACGIDGEIGRSHV